MIQFVLENKEILSICISLSGVLLTLAFGGVLGWRHKICFEYESKRSVAINILRDRYIQSTTTHHTDVVHECIKKKTDVGEIYKRPETQKYIQQLAKDLGDQNRVRRLFRWLMSASYASFGCIWTSIIVTLLSLISIWISVPIWLLLIWSMLFGAAILGFIASISFMYYLDGKFFKLVNGIIETEGELN